MSPRSLSTALIVSALLAPATLAPSWGQSPAARPDKVPEPAGLYHGVNHGYTPSTLKGGTVLDTASLGKLIDTEHPLLLDVDERERKPPSMAKDMLWLPQHRSIPGTTWLPGAGNGTDDPAFAAAFKARVAALAGGKLDKPVVVFCHPDCWASYNGARRLVGLGYTHVYWYPGGMEGWQAEHDTGIIKPDQAWIASLPKALTQ